MVVSGRSFGVFICSLEEELGRLLNCGEVAELASLLHDIRNDNLKLVAVKHYIQFCAKSIQLYSLCDRCARRGLCAEDDITPLNVMSGVCDNFVEASK
jgi:hypothetical protein